ncbi:MAG: hypothetical protein ACM3S1_04690 [Hyphomicrobiales bacterium]
MTARIKDQAGEMVERLPDDATWDDLQYEVELRLKVARGLADSRAGRMISLEEMRRRFGVAD